MAYTYSAGWYELTYTRTWGPCHYSRGLPVLAARSGRARALLLIFLAYMDLSRAIAALIVEVSTRSPTQGTENLITSDTWVSYLPRGRDMPFARLTCWAT